MLKPKKFSRRRFLLGGLAMAGAMVVGWGVMPPRQRLRGKAALPLENGAVALNGWIAIAPDGSVQLAMPRADMGAKAPSTTENRQKRLGTTFA